MRNKVYRLDEVQTVKHGNKCFRIEIHEGLRRVGSMRVHPAVIAWEDPWGHPDKDLLQDVLAFFNTAGRRFNDTEKIMTTVAFIILDDAFGRTQAWRWSERIGEFMMDEGVKRTYSSAQLFAEMVEANVERVNR